MPLATVTKVCAGCHIARPGGCYSVDRTRRDGLSIYCDLCLQERRAASGYNTRWYRENKERHIANTIRRQKMRRSTCDAPRKRNPVHMALNQQKTLCGWPIEGRRIVGADQPGELMRPTGCGRCRKAYEVLWRCNALDAATILRIAHINRR